MKNVTTEPKSGYRLVLKGDGVTVERSISEALAKDIIAMVLVGESTSQPSPQAPINAAMPQVDYEKKQNNSCFPRKSLREYLTEVGAKKNPQIILAIAKFLQESMGKTIFSIADIKPQFRSANQPIPGNLHRDFQNVVQNGWIAPDHAEKKMFFITQTGLDALANKFE